VSFAQVTDLPAIDRQTEIARAASVPFVSEASVGDYFALIYLFVVFAALLIDDRLIALISGAA
jgi:hypothetical protein